MRSPFADRALFLVVLAALSAAPVACRDDKPRPIPPGTGGARPGTGGSRPNPGTGGARMDAQPEAPAPTDMDAAPGDVVPPGDVTVDPDAVPPGDATVDPDLIPPADLAPVDTNGDVAPSSAMRPFPATLPAYPAGTVRPGGGQMPLDTAVGTFYNAWKSEYVKNACAGSFVQAPTDKNVGNGTVADIHGLAMISTVIMAGHDANAKSTFDGMFRFARMYKAASDPALMAQSVNRPGTGACAAMAGSQAESQGNLHIALALLLADKQWGSAGTINYYVEGKNTVAAIKAKLMNPTTKLPLVGDYSLSDAATATQVLSSTLVPGHFQAFFTATGDTFWNEAVTAAYDLIAKVQAGPSSMTGLLPDLITNTASATPGAGAGDSGYYFYEAARVPLLLSLDYIANSTRTPGSKAALDKITAWIKTKTGGIPAMVVDGYQLNGNARPGGGLGESPLFETPFGAGALVDAGNQAWVDAVWTRVSKNSITRDANVETTQLLALIAISGHWWAP